MEVVGKYGKAVVYNDTVEQEAISQIINLLNQPMAENAHVRVMPDIHAGAGCVIGYTAKLTDYVVPNLIGVDIGCSVSAVSMQTVNLDAFNSRFEKLIPVGRNIHKTPIYHISDFAVDHIKEFEYVCKVIGMDIDYMKCSLGTLGGGNHYSEVDVDSKGDWWFTLHTGSRNFGLRIAKYFQDKAQKVDTSSQIEKIKCEYSGKDIENKIKELNENAYKPKGLEWLEPADRENYLTFMRIAQNYAKANHNVIIRTVLPESYLRYSPSEYGRMHIHSYFTSHNYIDMYNGIIRKGAVSAQINELFLIPLNMRDGTLFCRGKGNEEWNFSAPHGAGRLMSRRSAKENLSFKDYEKSMEGVYSTCVSKSTLDESPDAYKNADEIKKYIEPTATILDHWKPVWNYKG